MARLISDRFRLEVRLGRDRDIEEWLGTDTALDRPVLVRLVSPEATDERRQRFLAAVRAAWRAARPPPRRRRSLIAVPPAHRPLPAPPPRAGFGGRCGSGQIDRGTQL